MIKIISSDKCKATLFRLILLIFLVNRVRSTSHDVTSKISSDSKSAYTSPQYQYYEYERDPRQYYGSGSSLAYGGYSPLSSLAYGGGYGLEAIALGLVVALGIGVIGTPLLLLFISLFTGSNGFGNNYVPPATTTTITGRRKRETPKPSLIDGIIDPMTQAKLAQFYEKFTKAPDKIEYLKSMVD